MRIGYVQSSPVFGESVRNVERTVELMRMGSADLWVLPELANTGYKFTSPEEARSLAEPVPEGASSRAWIAFARETGSCLVAGLAELAGDEVYNSALICSPEGHVATYRKTHLFDAEKRWFARGNSPPTVLDLAGAKVGVMICFDWFFPEYARTLALLGAEVLAHPANLVLPWGQRAMLTRAVENRVFAITCNRVGTEDRGGSALTYTGSSQIVSPSSEMLSQASDDCEEIGVAEIDPAVARDKQLNEFNDLFADRRPDHYLKLGQIDD